MAAGLKMNHNKIKIMSNNNVKEHTNQTANVMRRIIQGCRAFGRLRYIFKNKRYTVTRNDNDMHIGKCGEANDEYNEQWR